MFHRFVLSINKNELIANDFHRYRYYLYWLLLDVIRLHPKLHRRTLFWKGGRSCSWSWAPTNLANYYQPSGEDFKERIRFCLKWLLLDLSTVKSCNSVVIKFNVCMNSKGEKEFLANCFQSNICELMSGKLFKSLYTHNYAKLITSTALNERIFKTAAPQNVNKVWPNNLPICGPFGIFCFTSS